MPGVIGSWADGPPKPDIEKLAREPSGWDELQARYVWAESDAEGMLRFAAAPNGDPESGVLWVTATGFRPRGFVASALPADGRVTLEVCTSTLARVAEPLGAAVAGARVLQLGLGPEERQRRGFAPGDAPRANWELDRLQGAFLRVLDCGEVGTAALAALPGPSIVWGTDGAVVSAPEVARPGEPDVELVLHTPVIVQGYLQMYAHENVEADVQVIAYAAADGIEERARDRLGAVPVRPDKTFGPFAVSAPEGSPLTFRVEGGGLIPVEVGYPFPETTRRLDVVIGTEIGKELEVRVFGETDAEPVPLEGARVHLAMPANQSNNFWHSLAYTDAEGRARLRGLRTHATTVSAEAQGHLRSSVPRADPASGEPVELVLERTGAVRGVCTYAGEPVEDFEVLYWRGDSQGRLKARFRGNTDGRFRIDDAPVGEVKLLATSGNLPEGELVVVQVALGEEAEVELQLASPVAGVGRVVDAHTRAPIGGAWVQPIASHVNEPMGPRGERSPVGLDGRFRLEAFAPKLSLLEAGAPGYAKVQVSGSPGEAGEIDFGLIELAARQSLTVRLEAPAGIEVGSLWFKSEGEAQIPYHQFPPHGVLEIEGVRAGRHEMCVVWPDGESVSRFELLVPGRPWDVTIEIPDSPELVVEILPDEGNEPTDLTVLILASRDGRGVIQERIRALQPGQRELVFRNYYGDAVKVHADSLEGKLLGTASARFAPGEERRILVPLTQRGITIAALDGAGAPVAEALAYLSTPDGSWHMYGETGAQGMFTLRGIGFDRLLVTVVHPVLGTKTGVEVAIASEGDTRVEVVLDGLEDLALRVADGGHPIAGARCTLQPPGGAYVLDTRFADAEGGVRWERMSPGAYELVVSSPSTWPLQRTIEHAAGAGPIDVPVLRLGGLRLALHNADGLPLAGVPVGLRHAGLGEDVTGWIDAGLLAMPASGLVTDATGALELDGIPRGTYALDAAGTVLVPVEVLAGEPTVAVRVLE